MKVPNAENAIIDPIKLRDYLLNPEHRRGGPKARLLHRLGYQRVRPDRLEKDLREQHLANDYVQRGDSDFGTQYVIVAPINTPSGEVCVFRSVWQVDRGTDRPRLLTMYRGTR